MHSLVSLDKITSVAIIIIIIVIITFIMNVTAQRHVDDQVWNMHSGSMFR